MKKLLATSCCVFFLAGCDQDKGADSGPAVAPSAEGNTAESATAPSALAPAPALFATGIGEDPCALLSAEMVATVAEQDVGALRQLNTSGMCVYSWKGANPGKASIGFIRTQETVEAAASAFSRAHKDMSGEQVAAAMDAVGDRAKTKLAADAAAGKKAPAPELVDPVTKQLADNSVGDGISFVSVPGVGDEAVFQTTRHETKLGEIVVANYANKLEVRAKNLEFDVSFSFKKKDAAAEPIMYKAQCVALANAVLDGLK